MQKTILITGCSSGIGAALAQEFARRGHRVYASARRAESLAALEAGGIRVRSVSRGTIFDRLGLRSGDLVRSIAGNRVLSIDDAAPVYARLLSADSFVIEVDRAGARLDLRVELIRSR